MRGRSQSQAVLAPLQISKILLHKQNSCSFPEKELAVCSKACLQRVIVFFGQKKTLAKAMEFAKTNIPKPRTKPKSQLSEASLGQVTVALPLLHEPVCVCVCVHVCMCVSTHTHMHTCMHT